MTKKFFKVHTGAITNSDLGAEGVVEVLDDVSVLVFGPESA